MTSRREFTILASVVGVVASVAAAGAFAGSSQPSARSVSVQLVEWKVVPSAAAVPAGKVSFRVANMGTMPHEMAIIRSERHHHLLSVAQGRASEKGLAARVGPLEAGQSGRVTVKLKPGKYVLLCNLLGHYKAGQFAALRVR